MRTFSTRTNALACWVAIGMLSACTVTVNDGPADKDRDSGVTTEAPDDTTGRADPEADAGGGETTSGDETDEDTGEDTDVISAPLDPDAGADTETEDTAGDGGTDPVSERFSCGSRDVKDAVEAETDIKSEVTWSGTVHVTRPVYLMTGGKLTIEPGTKIIMDVDSFLDLGYNNASVSVFASGTPEKPITICGSEPDAGFWRYITFGKNVTSNSTFKNVLVSDGGSGAAAVVFNADVHVDNLQVANSGDIGVSAVDFASDSTKLSVFGAKKAAVRLTGPGAFTNFPLGGTFEDNTRQLVEVDFGDIRDADEVTIRDVGLPYLQLEPLYLYGSSTLTIEAGVDYRFSADTFVDVGYNSSDPTLFIEGTEDAPVIFQGQSNEPGYWRGLSIGTNVRTNSEIKHLTIRDGGGDDYAALHVRAAITLSDVTLEGNEKGALIGNKGLDPDSANLTISDTAGVPLTVEGPDALVALPKGGSYTGNQDDVIAIDGDSYRATGTVANLGVPYRVLDSLYTYGSSSMTIEPGVTFEMRADTLVNFGYNSGDATVHAVGTEDAPIVFVGVDPAPGSWRGIDVGVNVTTNSSFKYVTVEHAGNPTNPESSGGLYLNAALAVENSSFNDIAGYGIILNREANAAIVIDNTAAGVTLGVMRDLRVD